MTTSDVITLVAAVAAVAGAGVAVWQAIRAARASKLSEEARDTSIQIAREQLALQERQTSAQEQLATASRPAPWSPIERGTGLLCMTTNTSGTDLTVHAVLAEPEAAIPLLHVRAPLPATVRHGEQLRFIAKARYMLAIQSISLEWSGSDGARQTTHLGLP